MTTVMTHYKSVYSCPCGRKVATESEYVVVCKKCGRPWQEIPSIAAKWVPDHVWYKPHTWFMGHWEEKR